jgi:hypothetical protein
MVTGNLLIKLCQQMWQLRMMPEEVVRRVLYFTSNNFFHVNQEGEFDRKQTLEQDQEWLVHGACTGNQT